MAITIASRILQTPAPDHLEALDAVIAVDDAGWNTAVEPIGSEAAAALLAAPGEHLTTPSDAVLLPGLVDLHVHAPQWPQLGTALDQPLERWLLAAVIR